MVVSNIFYFTPILGEMIQFDEHIFQMGWFNHQLEKKTQHPGRIFFLFASQSIELRILRAAYRGAVFSSNFVSGLRPATVATTHGVELLPFYRIIAHDRDYRHRFSAPRGVNFTR